ncbi:hypothetical protein EV130_101385 [Rhizobium azibense]|uniref:Uncharacterized protein n=1 Tax=Rhizobium azibense TaxID=1136135 RepID=A0A4R3R6M8_9HYPH|nr:hypothetical protein EV130_101385 [Rhizobium azibense]TCU41171.1 hypothetical protein EV129_101458 [Rhizobium azibense]
MSGKGLRITASVLRFSLRYWQARSGQAVLAMAREARRTTSVMARDEVCNARAWRYLQIQPAVIMLQSHCIRSYRTAPVATISGVMVRWRTRRGQMSLNSSAAFLRERTKSGQRSSVMRIRGPATEIVPATGASASELVRKGTATAAVPASPSSIEVAKPRSRVSFSRTLSSSIDRAELGPSFRLAVKPRE